MIGFLRGHLASLAPPRLVIDVQGVGYEVEAPMSTCFNLPGQGQEVTLFTHLIVTRDNDQTLYAFATASEQSLFRELIKVSGIGGKAALTILSGVSPEELARCVEDEDAASLVRLPGIGPKTAKRLVLEMKDRMPAAPGERGPRAEDSTAEARDALIALGYKPKEAARMLKDVDSDGLDTQEILRKVLRTVVKA